MELSEAQKKLAGMIDHTLLKPDATPGAVRKACAEALAYGFCSVAVQPSYVRLVAQELKGSPVRTCTVVGFPLGANISRVKAYEAEQAIAEGAQEIDMVLNIGALKSGDGALVQDDMAAVVAVCHSHGVLCKVILENCYLTDVEKMEACQRAKAAGADFVKTSTGFGPGGATVADVALMRAMVGPKMGVKAAGGIRTYAIAMEMIGAGANRIGCSASVQVIQSAG